jgi:hypothetical protein
MAMVSTRPTAYLGTRSRTVLVQCTVGVLRELETQYSCTTCCTTVTVATAVASGTTSTASRTQSQPACSMHAAKRHTGTHTAVHDKQCLRPAGLLVGPAGQQTGSPAAGHGRAAARAAGWTQHSAPTRLPLGALCRLCGAPAMLCAAMSALCVTAP